MLRLPFSFVDIVVGGSAVNGIYGKESYNDATVLAGKDEAETIAAIKNYSQSRNVYGASADINNAKSILGFTGFNYIETNLPGFTRPTFTCNDIIVGGSVATGIPDNVLNGATRLSGNTKDETEQKIRNYAHTPDIPNGKYGKINRDPASMLVRIVDSKTNAPISIPNGATFKINSSSGDYYNCSSSYSPNEVKVLKAYLTKVDAPPVTPPGTGKLNPEELKPSKQGVDFIKGGEGYEKFAYADRDGKMTIGYGHVLLPGESYPNGISKDQALALLQKDIKDRYCAKSLDPFLKKYNIKLTQYQYDALVSFTYNIGEYKWNQSFDLKDLLKSGNYTPEQITAAFTKYYWATDPVKGNWPSLGLWRRRMDEAELFNTGDYTKQDRNGPPELHLRYNP